MEFPGSEALRYRLVSGVVDVAPLRILATETFVWQGWQATAHVLGASHALVLEKAGSTVTELFTCASAGGEPPAVLALDSPGTATQKVGNLTVAVRVWQEVSSTVPTRPSLSHTFPCHGQAVAPVTQLHWTAGPALRLVSVHTYPEEPCAVWTETFFTETTP